MDTPIDSQKTLEVIQRLQLAKIGDYNKWKKMIKKIKNQEPLNPGEIKYYTTLTRIYKDSGITNSKNKAYHTKLSDQDEKPSCMVCGKNSTYYCSMNDQYFCTVHLVGHDENER